MSDHWFSQAGSLDDPSDGGNSYIPESGELPHANLGVVNESRSSANTSKKANISGGSTMSAENTIPKTKCQFKFGKEIKIKKDKISGAENGYVKLNSNQLKFTRQPTVVVPLIVGFLFFIFNTSSGGAYALGAALGAALITAVIVIVFDNINVIKVDKSQVINCMLESNSKRIVLKLSNGKQLAITGDDTLLKNISYWTSM